MSAAQHAGPGLAALCGMRADERAVRLLFVEHSADYATLVNEALQTSEQGSFEVDRAQRLEPAADAIAPAQYDAILLDLTNEASEMARAADDTIESAARLAARLPVIVLTGSESEALQSGPADAIDAADVRDRIARSSLPEAILRAVRRHRRLGQQAAAEPIVLRDPLRSLAKRFVSTCCVRQSPRNG